MTHPTTPNSTFTPSSLDEAKSFARALRRDMAAGGETISHSRALELTAHRMGLADWNRAAAMLGARRPFRPQVGDRVRGVYLGQDFSGVIETAARLGGGAQHQVAIQLDAPIDVVTFESFSNYRYRLTATLDERGRTAAKTSNGEPHMIVFETVSDTV